MSEVIPVTQVQEVRGTFTPSPWLREEVIANFLGRRMDPVEQDALIASFLLRSWQRRVLDVDPHDPNADPDVRRALADASSRFALLPQSAIRLAGQAAVNTFSEDDPRGVRLTVVAQPDDPTVLQVTNILSLVPTIERPTTKEKNGTSQEWTLFYIDITKRDLGARALLDRGVFIKKGVDKLRRDLQDPQISRQIFFTPKSLVVRPVLDRVRRRVDP